MAVRRALLFTCLAALGNAPLLAEAKRVRKSLILADGPDEARSMPRRCSSWKTARWGCPHAYNDEGIRECLPFWCSEKTASSNPLPFAKTTREEIVAIGTICCAMWAKIDPDAASQKTRFWDDQPVITQAEEVEAPKKAESVEVEPVTKEEALKVDVVTVKTATKKQAEPIVDEAPAKVTENTTERRTPLVKDERTLKEMWEDFMAQLGRDPSDPLVSPVGKMVGAWRHGASGRTSRQICREKCEDTVPPRGLCFKIHNEAQCREASSFISGDVVNLSVSNFPKWGSVGYGCEVGFHAEWRKTYTQWVPRHHSHLPKERFNDEVTACFDEG